MQKTAVPPPSRAPKAPARALAKPARGTEAAHYERVYVWQWPIRAFHWAVAAAITVLLVTGWLISAPVFTASGEASDVFVMGRVRQVHFAAGMVFAVAYVWRVAWFFLGNRFARSGFPYAWRPSWWRAVVRQAWDYLRFDFRTSHLGHNSLAGLSYVAFVFGLGMFQLVTGFALFGESDPGGFWDRAVGWVIPLLGGSAPTHVWHNVASWGFVVFVILHLYIVLLDAREYRNGLVGSMITGFKFMRVPRGERRDDDG